MLVMLGRAIIYYMIILIKAATAPGACPLTELPLHSMSASARRLEGPEGPQAAGSNFI
jgi:hypothetical protein